MPKTILVVDDEPDTTVLLSLTLKREGYQVLTADGGRSCLEMAVKHRPDLIILDVMMPDMSGKEVLKYLHRVYKVPPVIFFTARDRVEDLRDGIQEGAFRYMFKPTSREKLLSTIQEALADIAKTQTNGHHS